VAEATRPVTAEVTGPVTDVTAETADVTGDAAEVPEPVLVLVLVPDWVLVLGPDAVLVLVPDPVLVLEPVTAEVTVPMAEVTEVGQGLLGGVVAACACRENASKASMIPAATIATCTARRATCRTIGCGMSSSRTTGTDQTWLTLPIISDLKRTGAPIFQPIFAVVTRSRDICDPSTNVHTVRSSPYSGCSSGARA
jgi:hypothetical protein